MNSSERVERGCQFLVGVPVVVVGFFVWMTHHPDAAWIEKAETLPVVGPLAEVFRGRWLPPALGPETPDEPLEVEVQAPPAEAPPVPVEVVGARPYVWLTPGQILRTEPRADSETLATVDAITNVRMLSRHDRWARVSYRRRAGWVELKETKKADTGNPPLGEAPAPNLPVPALEPSADRLAHARRLLGTQEASRSVGPYPLYTDFDDDALLEFLDRAASGVETSYSQRYGLTPIGEPREAVVLFAREEDYRAFSAREERIVGITATGHATAGLVALYAEGRPWWEVASTLVHEITHLVNRRALGPALPPWLDEGIAGDLGSSRFADDGSLVLGSLGGTSPAPGARSNSTAPARHWCFYRERSRRAGCPRSTSCSTAPGKSSWPRAAARRATPRAPFSCAISWTGNAVSWRQDCGAFSSPSRAASPPRARR